MPFEEFAEKLQHELQEKLGGSARICLHTFRYNNGGERRALCVMYREQRLAPAVCLEHYYRRFCCGEVWSTLLQSILQELEEKTSMPVPGTDFTDWEKGSGLVRPMLVSREKNGFRRGNCPHRDLLDLTILYYLVVEMGDQASGTVLVENSHCRLWGVGEEELYETALKNLEEKERILMEPLEEAVRQLTDPRDVEAEEELAEITGRAEKEPPIFVLTISRRRMGAAAILMPGAMKGDPMLWPPDVNGRLIGKDPHAGKG